MERTRGLNLDRALSGIGAWIWLLLAAAAGSALVFTGLCWLLPAGQAFLAWPVLWQDLRRGRLGSATSHMLVWAFFASVIVIEISVHFPRAAEAGILNSTAYREEMFRWIRTGVGMEGTPSQFVPQQIFHYLLTLGLSALTLGFGGLLLGAILLNYMNYYVGSLIREAAHPALASVTGWPIWPIVRVAAFVIGALAAATILPGRVLGRIPWNPRAVRRALLLSFVLFLLDMLIKAALAPAWRRILEKALGS